MTVELLDKTFLDKFKSKLWRLDNIYHIIDKYGTLTPLKLNNSQLKVLTEYKHPRKIILKSRQQGISTLYLAYIFDTVLTKPNYSVGIQSYGQDETTKLKNKVKIMWKYLHKDIKTLLDIRLVEDNKQGMKFSNDSVLRIGNFRGDTLQMLHVSELAKIDNRFPERSKELKSGAFQAVGINNMITIESTAEGRTGLFFDTWQKAMKTKGKSLSPLDFQPIFLSWVEDPDCNLDYKLEPTKELIKYFYDIEKKLDIQLKNTQKWWYIAKINELGDLIQREYPTTPEEAFEQSLKGSIYTNEYNKIKKENRIIPMQKTKEQNILISYDLGINDETVVLFLSNLHNIPKLLYCYSNSGKAIDHYIDVMLQVSAKHSWKISQVILPHDANVRSLDTGRTRVERFNSLGIPTIVLNKQSIQDGIEATRQLLNIMYINDECVEFINAIQEYKWYWDTRAAVYLQKPDHNWASNFMDSLRYMALGLHYQNTLREKKYSIDTYYGV